MPEWDAPQPEHEPPTSSKYSVLLCASSGAPRCSPRTPMGGRQPAVVSRGEPHLHREPTRHPRSSIRAAERLERGVDVRRRQAHSISRNRTDRLVANTRAEASVNSRSPRDPRRHAVDGGHERGDRATGRAGDLVQAAADEGVVDPLADGRERMPRGALGSSVLVFVIARSVCGNQSSSEWSAAATRSSSAVSTSSRGSGCLIACSTYAGTHCSVTSTRMPSAPAGVPPRAPIGILVLVHEEIAGRRHQRRTHHLGREAAEVVRVPCVPVEIAPAIDWRSMSPRFSIARPMAPGVRARGADECRPGETDATTVDVDQTSPPKVCTFSKQRPGATAMPVSCYRRHRFDPDALGRSGDHRALHRGHRRGTPRAEAVPTPSSPNRRHMPPGRVTGTPSPRRGTSGTLPHGHRRRPSGS